MVSSTLLSNCVAKSLGLPPATVALHMRNIREAGLVTQGGRGRSSARLAPADASALLIASVGSLNPKDSVEAVKKYGARRATKGRWDVGLVPKLSQLPGDHTFSEALTAMIESAVANEISIMDKDSTDFEAILFTLSWPWHGVSIQFYKYDKNLQTLEPAKPFWRSYGAGYFLAPSLPPIPPSSLSEADFQQQRQFTHRTVFALADLFNDSQTD